MKKTRAKTKAVDVLSHVLLPDMEVLSGAEKSKVLSKYNVSENQVPIILQTDPAVAALKAEPGNLIKITRKEETGECISYRIVA